MKTLPSDRSDIVLIDGSMKKNEVKHTHKQMQFLGFFFFFSFLKSRSCVTVVRRVCATYKNMHRLIARMATVFGVHCSIACRGQDKDINGWGELGVVRCAESLPRREQPEMDLQ